MPASYKKLWNLLEDRGMLKQDLRELTGLSSVSMAKLSKNQNMHTDVLVRICNALDCSIEDIVEITNYYESDLMNELIENFDKIHTTDLGADRIKKNLKLETEDVISWCKEKIKSSDNILKKGKNWYVCINDIRITVNAHSYTIITAHKGKASNSDLFSRAELD